MQPEFPRISQGITFTNAYYKLGRIKDHFFRYAEIKNGMSGINYDYLDTYYELVFDSHKRMEDEINQTIFTTDAPTKVFLFENLKEWLNQNTIQQVDRKYISNLIDDYNDKKYSEFLYTVGIEEAKFIQQPNFRTGIMNEESEVKVAPIYSGLIGGYFKDYKVKKYNRWFYCIEPNLEMIDRTFIDDYVKMFDVILSNFRRIVTKYVSQYDSGKIVSFPEITEGKKGFLNISNENFIDNDISETKSKLKTNLSVHQIAYLFKKLYDLKIIEADTAKEIHQFISTNFQSVSKTEEISIGNLGKLWSDTEVRTVNFWKDKFIELHNQAKKDNQK